MYKARDKARHFWVEHAKRLLDACNLLGGHECALAPHDARLLYLWSQSAVRDELVPRQRALSLLFPDFLEARSLALWGLFV